VSDGKFPAINQSVSIHVEPVTLSFAGASSSLTLVQGDRLVVLNAACLPIVTNGPPDTASYRVTRAPTNGQLLHKDRGRVEEFSHQQVRRTDHSSSSYNRSSSTTTTTTTTTSSTGSSGSSSVSSIVVELV